MRTKILLSTMLFLGFICRAQNYPYLNASTGNAGQSFTDADTNIYMYRGNQLEKLTKNLVPIWAKTYNNFAFSNILLSKTGSMYFIGSDPNNTNVDRIGKLDATGNVVWIKTIGNSTITIGSTTYSLSNVKNKQLLLDRNNDLILTSSVNHSTSYQSGLFMKMDTVSGAILKTRLFYDLTSPVSVPPTINNFNIINDSLGNYKIYGDGGTLSIYSGFIINYSELLDSVNKTSTFQIFSYSNYWPKTYFYRSKIGSEFYVGSTVTNNSSVNSTFLNKYNTLQNVWNYSCGAWVPNNCFTQLQEDEKGNLFLVTEGYPFGNYNKGFLLLDSNGVFNGVSSKFLSNLPFSSMPNIPKSQVHVLHNGNYFFDAVGAFFPTNPITIGKYPLACDATIAPGSVIAGSSFGIAGNFDPNTYKVSSILTPTITSSATPVANYTVAVNFCIVAGIENNYTENNNANVFPNPTNSNITIKTAEKIGQAFLYNNLGELIAVIKIEKDQTFYDMSKLQNGIYFLRTGSSTKKIVKE